MTRIYFADEFYEDLVTNQKTQTLRYNLSDEPSEGDTLTVIVDGEEIGVCTVSRVERINVSDVSSMELDGHRNYETTQDVLDHLTEYYDDPSLDEHSTLTLIGFELKSTKDI